MVVEHGRCKPVNPEAQRETHPEENGRKERKGTPEDGASSMLVTGDPEENLRLTTDMVLEEICRKRDALEAGSPGARVEAEPKRRKEEDDLSPYA